MTVLDINNGCLERVKERTPGNRNVTCQEGDIVNAQLSGKFELIDRMAVLCHLDPPKAIADVMRNMAAGLKQGGIIAIDDILHNNPDYLGILERFHTSSTGSHE